MVFDMDYPLRSFPTFCSILSLQPFYSALVIKTYPTNLQGSFLLFILRPQIRFLFLSATLFLLSQPIYPTYHFFHASNTHFLHPTLPFCHQLSSTNFLTYFVFFSSFNHLPPQFTNQFSQTIFFSSNHFHQPATINSGRSFFLATVLPTNNHHCHLIVIWTIQSSFLTLPPSPLQFFGKTFHFFFIQCKVLGGALWRTCIVYP